MPQLGTGLLVPVAEEDVAVFGEYYDGFPLEEDVAVVIAKRSNSHQIVVKAGHYVACNIRQLRERDVAGC